MKNPPLLSMRLIERKRQLTVVDAKGDIICQFDSRHRKYAEAFAMLPNILLLLDAAVDGAEGYMSEVGDDSRYWRSGVLNEARIIVDRLLPWAKGQ